MKNSIEILYEDTNILAINKPAGLIVHSDGKSEEKTLTDWILENYPEIWDVGESMVLENGKEIKRPGIVHRLDKETSGVMLIAKTKKGFEYLKNLFKERKLEKTYHAFVYGNIKPKFTPSDEGVSLSEDEFVITAPIGRSKNNIRKWTAGKDARGEMREVETYLKVLKRISFSPSALRMKGQEKRNSVNLSSLRMEREEERIFINTPAERVSRKEDLEAITFIEAKPKTGRTHQIRVHLNYIGRPILCDSLYTKRKCLLGFDRVALHAKSISFKNMDGEEIFIEAPYPEDFSNALKVFAD